MSSILSASSRTRYVTRFRLVLFWSRWSISLPGVANKEYQKQFNEIQSKQSKKDSSVQCKQLLTYDDFDSILQVTYLSVFWHTSVDHSIFYIAGLAKLITLFFDLYSKFPSRCEHKYDRSLARLKIRLFIVRREYQKQKIYVSNDLIHNSGRAKMRLNNFSKNELQRRLYWIISQVRKQYLLNRVECDNPQGSTTTKLSPSHARTQTHRYLLDVASSDGGDTVLQKKVSLWVARAMQRFT